jgi:Flp pilus assembly protein TadD
MKSQNDQDDARRGSGFERFISSPVSICLFLTFATCAVFYPVVGFDYVNLDDFAYVTNNPRVQEGLTWSNVAWAFRTTDNSSWYPFMWLSFMLDVTLFGRGATGPHLMNLLLHLANTVALFLLTRRLPSVTWRSAIVAALFALHPLQVESVAWIAERKGLLSTWFGLLTFWAYASYVEKSRTRAPRRRICYGLALGAFGCSLLSKPMLVTLPFLLLLLDYWPLERLQFGASSIVGTANSKSSISRLLLEKVPFLAMSLVAGAATVLVHEADDGLVPFASVSMTERIANAFVSYAWYVQKAFWPDQLAVPYPAPTGWPPVLSAAALTLIVGFSIVAVWLRRRYPYVFVGWFWFVVTLAPVTGFIGWGVQIMADRYTYVPLVGVFVIAVWGVAEIFAGRRVPRLITGLTVGLVVFSCASRSRQQLLYWRNTETLLSHALEVTKDNWLANYNLGCELERQERLDEALMCFRRVIAIMPYDVDSLNNLGNVLVKKREFGQAIPYYETALRVNPARFQTHYNIGKALVRSSRFDEAIGHFEAFLQHKPDDLEAMMELGVALAVKGHLDQAIVRFREILGHQPDNAQAHYNLGQALALQDKLDEAVPHLKEALRIRPGYPEAERTLRGLGLDPSIP